jgi:hypothetical protein
MPTEEGYHRGFLRYRRRVALAARPTSYETGSKKQRKED